MQDRWLRSGKTFLVSVVLVVLCTSCRSGDVPPPPQRASLTYRLATHGLPMGGIWKSTPVFVDLNQDGFLDLASLPRLGHGARVWLGDAHGRWSEASDGLQMDASCGGGLAFGDLNRDGYLDLAVADHCAGVFVYLGDGQGHWRAVTTHRNPTMAQPSNLSEDDDNPLLGAEDLALGDVNEDGLVDLVVAASNQGGFTVYLGDGSGSNWQEVTGADGLPSANDPEAGDQERGGWANRVLLVDIDGDQHLDVVASYYAGPRVWRGDGKGQWRAYADGLPRPAAGGRYRGLAVGDIDEDGRLDLVVANVVDGLEVYVQQHNGTWQVTPSPVLAGLLGGVQSVALGDVNRDGHLDLVLGGRRAQQDKHSLFVFQGNGKAAWIAVEATQLAANELPFVWGITLGDANGDGALDVAVGSGAKAPAAPAGHGAPVVRPAAHAPQDDRPPLQVWMYTGT